MRSPGLFGASIVVLVACSHARSADELAADDEAHDAALVAADPTCRRVVDTGLPLAYRVGSTNRSHTGLVAAPEGTTLRVFDAEGRSLGDVRAGSAQPSPPGVRVCEPGHGTEEGQPVTWITDPPRLGSPKLALGPAAHLPLDAHARVLVERTELFGQVHPSGGAKARTTPWFVVRAIDLDGDGAADLEEREHQCGCYRVYRETRFKRDGAWQVARRTEKDVIGDPRFDRCAIVADR